MKPRRPKTAYAMQTVVEDLATRFVYPDLDTRGGAPFFAGGGGMPTVTVAAFDASELSKSKSDYVCVGESDQQTIRAAYNRIGAPCRINLTEGTFNFGTATLFLPAGVQLQGVGHGTVINTPAGDVAIEFIGDDAMIKDLKMVGASSSAPNIFVRFNNQNNLAENVGFVDGATVFDLQLGWTRIIGCNAPTTPVFIDAAAFGSHFMASGNGLNDDTDVGVGRIRLGASAADTIIANNIFRGGIEDTTASHSGVIIANNTWVDVVYISSGHAIIDTNDGDISYLKVIGNTVSDGGGNSFLRMGPSIGQVTVLGNTCAAGVDDGILVPSGLGTPGTIISGNSIICAGVGISSGGLWEEAHIADNFIDAGEHGMDLADLSRGHVYGNTIYRPGLNTDDTFDGIRLSGASGDETYIHGNRLIVFSFGNAPRYGVNVSAATCENNIIVGNDLGDPADYGTDALNDAGTGTILTYPNDATYGDNFT